MEQHDDAGFVPDAYNGVGSKAKAGMISPLRSRWRGPAIAASVAVVAALCLHTAPAAQGTASVAKRASITAQAVSGTANGGAKTSLTGHIQLAADSTASKGGVHGAFSMYDGPGGGIEFFGSSL